MDNFRVKTHGQYMINIFYPTNLPVPFSWEKVEPEPIPRGSRCQDLRIENGSRAGTLSWWLHRSMIFHFHQEFF